MGTSRGTAATNPRPPRPGGHHRRRPRSDPSPLPRPHRLLGGVSDHVRGRACRQPGSVGRGRDRDRRAPRPAPVVRSRRRIRGLQLCAPAGKRPVGPGAAGGPRVGHRVFAQRLRRHLRPARIPPLRCVPRSGEPARARWPVLDGHRRRRSGGDRPAGASRRRRGQPTDAVHVRRHRAASGRDRRVGRGRPRPARGRRRRGVRADRVVDRRARRRRDRRRRHAAVRHRPHPRGHRRQPPRSSGPRAAQWHDRRRLHRPGRGRRAHGRTQGCRCGQTRRGRGSREPAGLRLGRPQSRRG